MAVKTVDSANGEISTGKVVLGAGVPDTVTFTNDADRVEIWTDGSADVNVRIDGNDATASGKFSFPMPAGAPNTRTLSLPVKVNQLSLYPVTGTPTYIVTRLN